MTTQLLHLLPALQRLGATPTAVELAQVGRDARLSSWHAQRVFSTIVGESPKQFQQRVRLQRGAAMLLGTDVRIIDVALACGFSTHESFTRAFGRQFGISPSRYRRTAGAGRTRHRWTSSYGRHHVSACTAVSRTNKGATP